MRKQISAAKLKKMPILTDVWVVNEESKREGLFFLIQCGKRKMLKSVMGKLETIKDRDGFHYEVEE